MHVVSIAVSDLLSLRQSNNHAKQYWDQGGFSWFEVVKLAMTNYQENNPNTPPLPWWPPARKSLWLGEERAGMRGSVPCPPPPQSSPIKGEDKIWQLSCFVGGQLAMTNYNEKLM